jgi:hypothetical protein
MGMHPILFCEVETDASYLKLTSESLVLPVWNLESAKLLLSDLIVGKGHKILNESLTLGQSNKACDPIDNNVVMHDNTH